MPLLVLACVVFVTNLQAQPPAAQPPTDVAAHGRAVLASITAKEFPKVEEQFDDKVKSALPPGRLESLWTALLNQAGDYKSCAAESRVVAIADKQMVITPCEFERAKLDIQIAFDAAGRISGLTFRPSGGTRPTLAPPYKVPMYADPSTYTEANATVGSGEWALPATLTVPVGAGPFPAIVLVHGSGPNDRDETVGANKPFKDLATGLASRGVAVLRYEKRTKVYGAKGVTLADYTVRQEVVDDALEAVKMLRTQPKIDPARVFVLGHSLGGMLAPRIAVADPKIAGLIVMAGAARPLEEAILAQARYLAMTDGTISPEEQKGIDEAAKLVEDVKALKPSDAAAGQMLFHAPTSYWLDLRGYDPPSAAKAVKAPMLILQGERDYQVTMEEFAKWKAALGSRSDVTFHSYRTLNHLFIPGTGPSLPAEYQVPGHVDEAVVKDIAAWVAR
jgi:hypothetical protein